MARNTRLANSQVKCECYKVARAAFDRQQSQRAGKGLRTDNGKFTYTCKCDAEHKERREGKRKVARWTPKVDLTPKRTSSNPIDWTAQHKPRQVMSVETFKREGREQYLRMKAADAERQAKAKAERDRREREAKANYTPRGQVNPYTTSKWIKELDTK